MVAPVVAALVGTGVGALLNPLTNNIMALVFKLLEVDKKIELWESFDEDIGFIQRESCMLAADQEDQLSGKGDPNNVKIVSMEQVRDLLYEIEDFLDRIMRCNECGRVDFKARFEKDVKKLKARLVEARQRKDNGSCLVVTEDAASSAVPANTGDLVGIEEPKQEILELLESQPEQLKVISIVGFSGSGKTTLARAVYDSVKLDYKAWVVASEHKDARGLLRALLKELLLRGKDPPSEDVGVQKLHTNITDILNANRYLIVLDDIEEERWVSIKHTFPRNTRGRIIVTTATQRVAKVCSRHHGTNGYVYNMRNLGDSHSKKLLEAVLQEHLAGLLDSSTLNVKKCDGHPLSLLSVANYLLGKDSFTKKDCETFWSSLDDLMKEPAFTELQQVLMNNYRSLPGQPNNLRTGLLYLSVFPNGHPIKRNRLIRRWLAEGYVQNPDPCKALLAADDNFEKLVDRNIIRPIDPSKNAKVKTCRAHGIIHEFMLYVAMSTKFITSFDSPQRRDYRHLYMDGRPYSARASNVKEELRAHSLTICGNAGKAVEDFDACELLRVLDLEECDDLEDKDMDGIHRLWHLKYLSLGAKVSRLPREIEQLHCLETLDMRKTKMKPLPVELPAEVIKLPHLVRLLGKFKLKKGDWKNPGLASFLQEKSNLQILAGFVMDNEDPGFSMLMDKMKKLSKVKIWFNSTGNGVMSSTLVRTAIETFVVKRLDTGNGDHSLSLDLGSSSKDILSSLDISSGYVSSLKLHGELSGLTMFATFLCGLTELCLSSSANDLMTIDLSNLRDLIHLVYLKLVKVNLEGFLFTKSDFRALQSLCLVQCLMLPKIEEEALPNLLSLRLLDQGLEGLSGIDMKRHLLLQEIALDSEVKQETKMEWEGAAKTHPKRPRVFYLQRVDPDGTGSMVKYVAVKKPIPETESSAVRGKRKIHGVESSSVTHVESKFKQMILAGPSLASTELPNATPGAT